MVYGGKRRRDIRGKANSVISGRQLREQGEEEPMEDKEGRGGAVNGGGMPGVSISKLVQSCKERKRNEKIENRSA